MFCIQVGPSFYTLDISSKYVQESALLDTGNSLNIDFCNLF